MKLIFRYAKTLLVLAKITLTDAFQQEEKEPSKKSSK